MIGLCCISGLFYIPQTVILDADVNKIDIDAGDGTPLKQIIDEDSNSVSILLKYDLPGTYVIKGKWYVKLYKIFNDSVLYTVGFFFPHTHM